MTSGLRERKKVATRLALHEAALRLVAERGADRVSIDDIAERAGVSPRTFFNYFPSKDDALVGLDPDHPARFAAAFTARPAGESAVQALRAVAHDQAIEMAEDPQLWPLRLRVVEADPALAARLARALDAALTLANDDYAAHRRGGQMDPPEVALLPPGAFADWMRAQGKLGGQHKVPRVLADPARFAAAAALLGAVAGPVPRRREA